MNNWVEYTKVSGKDEHLIIGNRLLDDDIVWTIWEHIEVYKRTV